MRHKPGIHLFGSAEAVIGRQTSLNAANFNNFFFTMFQTEDQRIIIFGNGGSGKSTLAAGLSRP